MPAFRRYVACMDTHQYTIRGVPDELDHAIREKAKENGTSVNQISIDLLRRGVEMEAVRHDLDWIQNSWVEDDAFDEAIRSQHKIERDLWK